jgi:Domain of unknown function (DUF4145)
MPAPELHQLSPSDHELMSLLFDAIDQPNETIDRMRFRAAYHTQIDHIDQLEASEYLIRDAGRYRIGLVGLVQMAGDGPRRVLADAEALWSELRKHYKANLNAMIPLKELAARSGLDLTSACRALIYMLDAPWSAGRSTPEDMSEVQVASLEDVLRFDTFGDRVQQMRQWQTDRIRQRSNAVVTNLAATAEPNRTKAPGLQVPAWLDKLPQDAQILMNEIYAAMDAGTFALPAMGIRAVVDVVSKEVQQGDIGSFRKKLDGLRDAGHLTPAHHDALDAVVDAGNAAAHRGFTPSAEALASMIAAVSHLLHAIYVMPESTRLLRAGTPARHG